MIDTEEALIEHYGPPLLRHRFSQDYEFEGKNIWNFIPTEIMIFRHASESCGGVIVYSNYMDKNQWHANDSEGTRFFIREVLNGKLTVNPIEEPWKKETPWTKLKLN